MAIVNQTLALIELATTYGPEIVSQINLRCTALRTLPIVMGRGPNIAWVVKSSGANAEAYAEGADVDNTASNAQADAVLSWAQMRGNSSITGLAESSAATSDSPQGNVQLLVENITDSLAALASLVNQHIFDGNGSASPAQITGLDTAIGTTGNAYATINRATSSYWDPYVFDPGSDTAITQQQIRKDASSIYTNSGEYPDLGLVSPGVFNSMLGMFDSRTQLMNRTDVINTARGKIQLSAGFEALVVEGIPWVQDKDATAGTLYYVNTRHTGLVIQQQPQLAGFGFTPGVALTANDGFGPVPLMAVIEALGKTGDSKCYSAKTYLNLRVRKPCACGVRKHVLAVT
jgi:hypothetical protein